MFVTALILAAAFLIPAFGDTPFVPFTPDCVVRDAVIDIAHQRVIAVAYDQNTVFAAPLQSGTRSAEFPAGQGPASLAVSSEGDYLACVNSVDGTVTLLLLPSLAPKATLAMGGGPSMVAATGDNRFVIADAYDDRIAVLDPADQGSVRPLVGKAGVPVALGVNDGTVAWIPRTEAAVMLLGLQHATDAVPHRVPFPAQPIMLRPMGKDRFLVATAQSLYLLDSASRSITASKAMPVTDFDVCGTTVAVLGGNDCTLLDELLNETGRRPLPIPAKRVRCGANCVVLLAPQTRQAGYWGTQVVSVAEKAEGAASSDPVAVAVVDAVPVAPPSGVPEPSPAPDTSSRSLADSVPNSTAEPESTEVPERSDASAPVIDPEPAPDTPTVATAVSTQPATPPAETAETAPEAGKASPASETAAAVSAPDKEDAASANYRQYPLFSGGIRAPKTVRPSANPLEATNKQGIRDALMRPIEFGEPGLGFSPPDWTEPLRDIEADSMQSDLTTGRTVLNDNVRLHLGEMSFRSDHFTYSTEAASYEASGNVLVEQRESKLTADALTYNAPDKKVAEDTFILEPRDEQSLAKRRLSMGRLIGDNVHVVEPTRELQAGHVDYDFATEKGELTDARGRASLFYYRAGKLHILGPEDMVAEDVWITTCSNEDPHYRIMMRELVTEDGEVVSGKGPRLHLGHTQLPFILPFSRNEDGSTPWTLDFATGSYADIGYYVNVGQQYTISPEFSLGPRLLPTTKEGIGLGADAYYDYTKKPSSRLFMTKGELHGLYTTEDRGYAEWYHRYEYDQDLVLRMQVEHWSDEYFYKDFFWDAYKNRTTPRTFANVTYRREDYIATGTVNVQTDSWLPGTAQMPEAAFHLLERPLAGGFYATFDSVNGYYDQNQTGEEGMRTVNTARLTYNWDPFDGLAVTPFYEAEGTWYQNERITDESSARFSNLMGVTLQTRLHKEYAGAFNFSGFKHVVVPSLTYSYRPSSTMDVGLTPYYDALDNVYGRSRLESKISNVFYGRDAETKEVWQVGRLTLYQGNDFWNEVRKTNDYELELDLRPRPWWGMQLAAERHEFQGDAVSYAEDYSDSFFFDAWEDLAGTAYHEREYIQNDEYSDYSRVLTQVYYDDTMRGGRFNSRVGFAYSGTNGDIYNREVLYGIGYRIDDNWSVSMEHIYDFDDNSLRRQTYEIRRRFHCFEAAVRFRDRESGFDVNMQVGLSAFSGPPLHF